ncbi:MAG: hypothetical protein WCY11_04765 [Novosphingobium sp.]
MISGKRRNGFRAGSTLVVLGALVAGLLAWAWVDGGREPVRPMTIAVPLPESAR